MRSRLKCDTWSDQSDISDSGSCDSEEANRPPPVSEKRVFSRHRGFLYDTCLRRTVDRCADFAYWLPGVRERVDRKSEVLEARLLVASTGPEEAVDEARQHYVTLLKVLFPTGSGGVGGNGAEGFGGVGFGVPIRTAIDFRLYHTGAVRAAAVWRWNPQVFVTASPWRTDLHVFNISAQGSAKTEPPLPDAVALAIPADTPLAHKKARRKKAEQERLLHLQWLEHRGESEPDAVLEGVDGDVTVLTVSPSPEGWTAAGGPEVPPTLWRLRSATKDPGALQPEIVLQGGGVTALAFGVGLPHVLAVGWAGGGLGLADVGRASPDKANAEVAVRECSGFPKGSVATAIAFCMHTATLFVAGDSTGMCYVIDIRRPSASLWTMKAHASSVRSVEWSPHQPSLFASGGNDGYCCVWDLRGRQGQDEKEKGVPHELVFKHAGHRHPVGALTWQPDRRLRGVVASVGEAEKGNLNVWRARNSIWEGVDPSGSREREDEEEDDDEDTLEDMVEEIEEQEEGEDGDDSSATEGEEEEEREGEDEEGEEKLTPPSCTPPSSCE